MNSQPGKKFNVICFSFMPWSNMWKRNQSMMAEIAKFDFIDKAIFVNPDISMWQVLKQSSANGKKNNFSLLFPKKLDPKIWNYTLFHVLPASRRNNFFETFESRRHLRRLRHLNGQTPFILFMNCPNIQCPYPLDELLKTAELSIFDLSDDFVQLVHIEQRKALYSRNVKKYVQAANMVLTVNDYLKRKNAPLNAPQGLQVLSFFLESATTAFYKRFHQCCYEL